MLVLGLDQSIRACGWCLYETPGDERKMVCGTFHSWDRPTADEQCDLFATNLRLLIGRQQKKRPIDFIVWEQASRRISAYAKKQSDHLFDEHEQPNGAWTVNADQLLLPEIQGIIRAAALFCRIPYESVPVSTWRAAIYGGGQGNLAKAAAKAKAKEYCRRLGIHANNEHEAEAACIARWAATCSQRFKMLRWRREVEAAA